MQPTDKLSTEVPQRVDNGTSEIAELLPVVVEETRKGYKTTEFWVTIAAGLLVWFDAVPMPEKYEGVVLGVVGVAYVVSRGLAKKGVANVTEGA